MSISLNRRSVFARLCSRPIPRVVTMMDAAKKFGYSTIFLSARREKGLSAEDLYDGHCVKRIGPFFPLLNGKRPLTYLISIIRYNYAFYKELKYLKPELIHCSDIETCFAVLLYRRKRKCNFIYNIHDNLSQRYAVPNYLAKLLNWTEGAIVLASTICLVPESFRKDCLPKWSHKKIEIIQNTPRKPIGFKKMEFSFPIKLFYGGWLDEGRGLKKLLSVVKNNSYFELVVAGDGSKKIIDLVAKNPRTSYLGFINHDEIMRETEKAHFIVAFYDPARPINLYAASNKIAESLSCGRPVICNSEMFIVKSLSSYKCLLEIPYDKIEKYFADCFCFSNVVYNQMCLSARTAYNSIYSWEVTNKKIIELFEKIS